MSRGIKKEGAKSKTAGWGQTGGGKEEGSPIVRRERAVGTQEPTVVLYQDVGQDGQAALVSKRSFWFLRDIRNTLLGASGVGDGQGSLMCCSPWGCKELDTTERLN